MIFFKNITQHLQSKNHKAFYLSLMRVFLGIFLLKEIVLKLPYTSLLYSNDSLFKFNDHSSFIVLGIDVSSLKEHYQIIISIYIIAILLFIFGVGKRVTAFFIFFLIVLLQKLNNSTVNGGDKMARLMMFYFVFANSFDFFCYNRKNRNAIENSTTNNLISNLAAYSMMIQLCLAYFFSFINKMNNPYWFNGIANYYVFNTEAFQGTSFNKSLAQSNIFVYTTTYFTLLFEGSFAFLIWFKPMRLPLLIGGLILHLGIYIFMMIYNLQTIFLLPYGLFFGNEEMMQFYAKTKKIFRLNFLK